MRAPGPSLSDWLGDPDDAVRLVTVRELLGRRALVRHDAARIGAPEPLVSHWSRLIDAPLAALIGTLSPLLGRDGAELATRIVWPALLFFALALIVAREAHRRAGPVARRASRWCSSTTSATALAQFRPGRIDHHNAQILCAVAGLLFLARSWDDRRAGWIAGALARARPRRRLSRRWRSLCRRWALLRLPPSGSRGEAARACARAASRGGDRPVRGPGR